MTSCRTGQPWAPQSTVGAIRVGRTVGQVGDDLPGLGRVTLAEAVPAEHAAGVGQRRSRRAEEGPEVPEAALGAGLGQPLAEGGRGQ